MASPNGQGEKGYGSADKGGGGQFYADVFYGRPLVILKILSNSYNPT